MTNENEPRSGSCFLSGTGRLVEKDVLKFPRDRYVPITPTVQCSVYYSGPYTELLLA